MMFANFFRFGYSCRAWTHSKSGLDSRNKGGQAASNAAFFMSVNTRTLLGGGVGHFGAPVPLSGSPTCIAALLDWTLGRRLNQPQRSYTMNNALTVPFHGNSLYVIDHNNQPYTPMRSVVEGMGLAWQSQLEKLRSNEKRWGITEIVIPSKGGEQNAICLPLRKLPGWFQSIHPNKVKPEIREKVITYQNECDDALWDYWTKEQATQPALSDMTSAFIPKDGRYVTVIKGGRVTHCQPVPENACVLSQEDMLKAINEPNGMFVSTAMLTEFAVATTKRLALRCAYYEAKSRPTKPQFTSQGALTS